MAVTLGAGSLWGSSIMEVPGIADGRVCGVVVAEDSGRIHKGEYLRKIGVILQKSDRISKNYKIFSTFSRIEMNIFSNFSIFTKISGMFSDKKISETSRQLSHSAITKFTFSKSEL